MDSFKVQGLSGKPTLKGEVPVEGAKNAVLPLMAAALVIEGETRISNAPDIADVKSMNTLIEGLGGYTTMKDGELSIRAQDARGTVLDQEVAKRLRASVLLIGSVLARSGKVSFPHPGGCVLGARPIDLFVNGFEKLGCTVTHENNMYTFDAPNGIQGGEIFFRVMSHTATETFMIAATNATAPVTLKNCAMEPEVVALAAFLEKAGARITGAGTPTIVIYPSHLEPLPEPFRVVSDRIEAGSFVILGALLGKEITVTNCDPKHLEMLIETLRVMDVPIRVTENSITVSSVQELQPTNIRTHEYPGFPTDLQAPFAVLLTQAVGESVLHEFVFDGRLNYAADLVRMGAHIDVVNPHKAIIKGPTPLKGRDIDGPDIRAGLAFLLAAAVADGESTIGNAHLIDRGYEKIEKKLRKVGLDIQRVSQ